MIGSGVAAIAAGCALLFFSSTGFPIRARLVDWSGYDGCMCEECWNVFGIGELPIRSSLGRQSDNMATMGYFSMGVGAIVGIVGVLPMQRAGRRSRGLCVRCGYDLAGLDDAVVCPECGAPRDA